jgi:hypothetical protein
VFVISLSGIVRALPYGSGVLAGFEAQSPQTSAAAGRTTQKVVGTVSSVKGSEFTIQTQAGRTVRVDATEAIKEHRCNVLIVGHAVFARGAYDQKGILRADTVLRAKDASAGR